LSLSVVFQGVATTDKVANEVAESQHERTTGSSGETEPMQFSKSLDFFYPRIYKNMLLGAGNLCIIIFIIIIIIVIIDSYHSY